MKKNTLILTLLILLGTINNVFSDPLKTPNKLERAGKDIVNIGGDIPGRNNFTVPKPKYASCQALVNTAQKQIFSQYIFEPTSGLTNANDTECTTNPLFLFAENIMKKANASRLVPGGQPAERSADSTALRSDIGNAVNNPLLDLNLIDNNDVISKMIYAMQGQQYGSYVRQLGLVNNSLSCSSRSSARVLDLLLANILAASMEGGLDSPAEQEKCVQGAFNAALNTFDQVQFTGFSFVQTVLTRDNAKARELLYPKYPVCQAGVWVFDFITGKLVQLKDSNACKDKKAFSIKDIFAAFTTNKDVSNKYRYLLGYLDEFADPRRFGSGYCSEYYVAGNKNFTCDVGLTCKNTSVNPDLGNIISGVDGRAADRLNGSNLSNPSRGTAGQIKPTRFGIPLGVADDFLCGRGGASKGSYDTTDHSAFGQPSMDGLGSPDDLSGTGKGAGSNASRNFFQCQAAVLFDTKIDPTTSCILNAMNNVMREEKRQSMPDGSNGPTDPSFVIGGVKDPSCKYAEPTKSSVKDWMNMKPSYAAQESPAFASSYAEGLVGAQSAILNTTLGTIGAGFDDWAGIATIFQAVTQTPVIVRTPEDNGAVTTYVIDARVTQSSSSKTGYVITLFMDIDRTDISGTDIAALLKTAFLDVANRMTNNKDVKTEDTKRPDGSEDPGIDQGTDNACTSSLDRALTTLAQCSEPDRNSQPRADGRPAGGGGLPGVNPLVVDPDPQGAGVIPPLGSVMAGLMACVDQYGRDVSAHSGSQFGPGGCLSPMTLCNTKECKSFQTTCTGPNQWQCSFAMCREDGACCGSTHTSRGGGSGDSSGNNIDCGERTWNPAKRACDDPDICGNGWVFNAGSQMCEPQQAPPTGGRGPGGPEQPRDGNVIPGENGGNNGNLTGCPPGTMKTPGGGCGAPG